MVWDLSFGAWILFGICILFLVIFTRPVVLMAQQETVFIPLIFAHERVTVATVVCLQTTSTPQGPEAPLYDKWNNSPWGAAGTPTYCAKSEGDFTHKLTWGTGTIWFTGEDLTGESYVRMDLAAAGAQFTAMQDLANAGLMEDYFNGFTAAAKKVNSDWFHNETSDNLTHQYVENIASQRPVFAIDADPVFVLYTRGATHPVITLQGSQGPSDVQVIYFVREDGQLKRMGDSMGSAFDTVFQGERFVDAAMEDHPFQSWKTIER